MKTNILTSLILMSTLLVSCSESVYEANTQILFSANGGLSYGNQTNEFQVDERIYALIILEAIATPTENREIDFIITFGFTNNDFTIELIDGTLGLITFDNDGFSYQNTIITNMNSSNSTFTFRITANHPSNLSIILDYSDPIPQNFDIQNVLLFY